ncbi:R3H domain-containing protein 4 [Bulinus truncatus]|nr:R3H domain-containing protein 4 [Bulinus truncatus]
MGLITGSDNDPSTPFNPYIENYNDRHIENNLLSSTDEEESDSQSVHSQRVSRPHRRPQKHQISVSQENLAKYGSRRGIRHARRLDNLRYLINLEEKDEDIVLNSPAASFEPSTNLFEELFDDPEKMEIWNSFVESSEEEQRKILNYRGLHIIKEDDEGSECKTAEDNWVMILDERSDHPAYSPVQCYNRVDRNLRTLLKRRHLPLVGSDWVCWPTWNAEIVTFFHDCPTSVFISDISNGFERMLLHALCQYLNLHSQSYDDHGCRRTQKAILLQMCASDFFLVKLICQEMFRMKLFKKKCIGQ